MTLSGDRGSWSELDEQSPMGLGVIRCNDAEGLMDLEDLAERRINNLHAFNKRRGSESLSLRQTIEDEFFEAETPYWSPIEYVFASVKPVL